MEAEILSEGYENDPRKNIHPIYYKEMIINPYLYQQPLPILDYEAFVAPENFDPELQEVNILAKFAAITDLNKSAIHLFSNSVNNITFTPSATYYFDVFWTLDGIDYSQRFTGQTFFEFNVEATKRYYVEYKSEFYHSSAANGTVWSYCHKYGLTSAYYSQTMVAIHMAIDLVITTIGSTTFYESSIQGIIKIPNSVLSIGDYSFVRCYGITKLILGENLQSIAILAFVGCANLVEIRCHALMPPTMGDAVFAGVPCTTIHVPVGTYAAYRAAPQWGDFATIIDDL